MELSKVLAEHDPAAFRTRHVKIQRDGHYANIEIIGPEMDFGEMMGYRTAGADRDDVKRGLDEEGYTFANLGVSAALTVNIKGNDYVIVARQRRPDIGDYAGKLISGYIESEDLEDPHRALMKELSEELLFVTDNNEVLRGFISEGTREAMLPGPYKTVRYHPERLFNVTRRFSAFEAPQLDARTVLLDGSPIIGNPRLYYQLPTGSSQLVFDYGLYVPFNRAFDPYDDSDEDDMALTLGHTEDNFYREDGVLRTEPREEGLLLIRMEDGDLTDEVYTYRSGKLRRFDEDLVMSEAFAPKDDGLVETENIPLGKYLEHFRGR